MRSPSESKLSETRKGILLSLVLILVGGPSVFAQSSYTVSRFTHETGDFVTQPLRWRGNDLLTLGLIAAGTALVMPADQRIRHAVVTGDRKYFRSVPIEVGRYWGEWYTAPIVAGAFGLHGWLADNASSRKIGFEVIQAVAYAATVTEVMKIAFGRARPYEGKGAFFYQPFRLTGVGFLSLPGGHVTSAMTMSTVLSRNARPTFLKILAYAPAGLTFISRVYQDKHWTSDEVLGASIGYFVATWVVDRHESKESAVSISSVYPLALSYRF